VATPVATLIEPHRRDVRAGLEQAANERVPVSATPLRLLAVHAHPDDESSKGAATLARYVSEGVEVLVATCTGGERGDILNPNLAPEIAAKAGTSMLEVRESEMAEAARILGVHHRWLGFHDSGWPDGDPKPPLPEGSFAALPLAEVAAPLVALTRDFRPHVITTYDENGGYPHPDHIRTHEVSMVAWQAAGDADAYPGLGEPWTPLKLYYHHSFNRRRIEALHSHMIGLGLDSPYADWLEDPERGDVSHRITTQVECADWFPVRDAALRAHATQIDPEGSWFAIPTAEQQRVWPTEDYELAASRIEAKLPESDLFAGLR